MYSFVQDKGVTTSKSKKKGERKTFTSEGNFVQEVREGGYTKERKKFSLSALGIIGIIVHSRGSFFLDKSHVRIVIINFRRVCLVQLLKLDEFAVVAPASVLKPCRD